MASDGEPRKFFSEASSRPLKSHFGEQKASTSVLRMTCCNHGLMGDFMGAFYRPLVPSQTRCFVGPPRLSGVQAPSGHVIRPLINITPVSPPVIQKQTKMFAGLPGFPPVDDDTTERSMSWLTADSEPSRLALR